MLERASVSKRDVTFKQVCQCKSIANTAHSVWNGVTNRFRTGDLNGNENAETCQLSFFPLPFSHFHLEEGEMLDPFLRWVLAVYQTSVYTPDISISSILKQAQEIKILLLLLWSPVRSFSLQFFQLAYLPSSAFHTSPHPLSFNHSFSR